MALVNHAKREINAKVVFFGPGLAGKATNLKHVYSKLKPEFRGQMKAMNVQDARMLFFDFTPPGEGNVEGFRVRFHVYTVSGGKVDPAAWKMVLKGVDGVVFVADSSAERAAENRESLDALTSFLKGYGQNLSSVPVVFQYNKSDLSDALEVTELERTLNPGGCTSFKASSQSGDGVLQTLLSLVKSVLAGLRSKGLEGISNAEGVQKVVEGAMAPQPSAVQTEEPPVWVAKPAPQAQEQRAPREQAPQHPSPAQEPARVLFTQGSEGATAATAPAAAEEPLSLELTGTPEAAGPGRFRLPLTIRSGDRSKSMVLTIEVGIEEE